MEKVIIRLALGCGVLVLLFGVASSVHVGSSAVQIAQTGTLDITLTTTLPTTTTDTVTLDTISTNTSTFPTTTVISTSPTLTGATTTEMATYVPLNTPLTQSCPFSTRENRTIIDFTRGGTVPTRELVIVANSTVAMAQRIWSDGRVAPGRYAIQLASYNDHTLYTSVSEYEERWYLELFDSSGKSLLKTRPTRDIADTESKVIELVEKDIALGTPAYRAIAHHTAYPDPLMQDLSPLCAALDLLPSLETTTILPVNNMIIIATTTAVIPTLLDTNVQATTTEHAPRYSTCPFTERPERIIIDFTKGGTTLLTDLTVRADGDAVQATVGLRAVSLPSGRYEVRLASYASERAVHQEWRLSLFDTSGSLVTKTPPSRDVPDWEQTFTTLVSEAFEVSRPVVRVAGVHNRQPSNESASVAILCASFDRTKEQPVLQKPVNATATTTTAIITTPPSIPTRPVVHTTTIAPPQPVREAVPPPPSKVSTHILTEVPRTAVKPEDVGVVSSQKEVFMEADFIEQRRAVVTVYGGDVFKTINNAAPSVRMEMVREFVRTENATSTNTGNDDELRQLLMRTSKEDAEIATPDASTKPQLQRFLERAGLEALRDTDGDGVSDFDESNIYNTDPDNPFTSGSVFTDGERILLGLDPRTGDMQPVLVESPHVAGTVVPEVFTLKNIQVVSEDASGEGATEQKMVNQNTSAAKKFVVTGTAKPFSFVTLYLYSTPIIVTVRTDATGHFDYTFDETLPDGEHKLYLATVNNTGKILAKSDPALFVKTAEAVQFTPPAVGESPVERATHTTVAFTLLMILLVAIGLIVLLGFMRAHHDAPETPQT
ncbi:MAG: hypothetical protein KBD24_02495 [Candidatus Pacebacteria bacterium]|nr:hypothetical protein [Candidatus Paceibacterota bacterium]